MSHDPYAFLKFEQQVDAIQRLFEHVDFVLGGALPAFAHVQGIVGDGCHAVERAKEALSFLHKAKSALKPQGMLSVDALRIVMPARADAVLDELRQTQPAGLDGAVPTSFDIAEVQRKAQERQAVAVESPFARAQRQAAQQKVVAEALRTHGPEVAARTVFAGEDDEAERLRLAAIIGRALPFLNYAQAAPGEDAPAVKKSSPSRCVKLAHHAGPHRYGSNDDLVAMAMEERWSACLALAPTARSEVAP